MTEINTTIRPACETCRAGCQSNRRRFWVQVFQSGVQIDFDSESGHLLFIIGGEIEIVHAEGTDKVSRMKWFYSAITGSIVSWR